MQSADVLPSPLLSVRGLRVSFGATQVLRDLSIDLHRGEVLGIVGESGSGKSTLALALMGLLPPEGRMEGEILVEGRPFSAHMRGRTAAMVFQEPATALHPLFRCGHQVEEAVRWHRRCSTKEGRRQTYALLERVHLTEVERIYRAYPHELSGGQRQRVLLAMALAGGPRLLIADEPTTALDTVAQRSILHLLRSLCAEDGLALALISHDLGVVAHLADRVLVLYQGVAVEEGQTRALLDHPNHPYTRGLLICRPNVRQRWGRLPSLSRALHADAHDRLLPTVSAEAMERRRAQLYAQTPLLHLDQVGVRYPLRRYFWSAARRWKTAIEAVSLSIYPGEIFGIAGESGSGKSTLGRVVAGLQPPSEGSVQYRGLPLYALPADLWRQVRREVQIVFQDPYRSLNPCMTVGETLSEPMRAYRLYATEQQYRQAVIHLLERIGLSAEFSRQYPHELSGGQRQRICIARALSVQPRLLICDEITSALDVSVQADILNLLIDLQRDLGITYLLISHDLSVLYQMCDRVLVLHQGRMEALTTPERLVVQPPSPPVQRLIDAALW